MSDQREAKRVRQACQNCRRKKSKCDGQRPICSFCHRLKQECTYEDGPTICHHAHPRSRSNVDDVNLATRVALLEAKLSLLDDVGSESVFARGFGDALPTAKRKTHTGGPSAGSDRAGESPDSSSSADQSPDVQRNKFTQLPPDDVLRSILDTYFLHCQNQPYVYFREASFYRRFNENELPEYLLMAMVAIAARFSNEPFFENRQWEAIETYGRTAWNDIFDKAFADDYNLLEIHAVQATNILAVVDFTAGRHHLGWVKIGLSVRFAQSLHLNSEPRVALPHEEEDERRLTFWSVYLLDRLSSCGAYRPPTIADSDCSTLLPSDNPAEVGFMPDLRALGDVYGEGKTDNLDPFAHTILMASVLGRVERQMLQHQSYNDHYPPWDSRSDFAAIYSLLLSFEGYSNITDVLFSDAIISRYVHQDGSLDHPGAGHLVFSTMLYHMNQCLLHHPYLVRKRLESCKARVPPSFLREVLRRSLEHAYQLTFTLRTVQRLGLTLSSFYGYAMIVSGSVYRLFAYHEDQGISDTAKQLYEYSLEFLERGQKYWNHYPRMAITLKNFNPDPASAKALVTATHCPDLCREPSLEIVESLLDYGWLSDPARSKSLTSNVNAQPDNPASVSASLQSSHSEDVNGKGILAPGPATARSNDGTAPPTVRAQQQQQEASPPGSGGQNNECIVLDHFAFDVDDNNHAGTLPDDMNMDFVTHSDLVVPEEGEDSWNDFITGASSSAGHHGGKSLLSSPSFPFPAAVSSALHWTPRLPI